MTTKISTPSNRMKPNAGKRRALKLSGQSVLRRASALRRAVRLSERLGRRLEASNLLVKRERVILEALRRMALDTTDTSPSLGETGAESKSESPIEDAPSSGESTTLDQTETSSPTA